MNLIQSIVLGIVQGLTEFLPISSSAHLRIVPAILGWEDPGAAFTAVCQLGTEAAVLIFFRHELWTVARKWLSGPRRYEDPDVRLGWFLIVATIPIGIIGFLLRDQIETGARNLWLVSSVLIVFALVLGYADAHGRHEREIDQLSWRDGVFIGLAQSLSLVPGVSRSGATMSAGLLSGLQRPAAARFSFLLAVPAVVASGLFELKDVVSGDKHVNASVGSVLVATLVAFVVGMWAIRWFLQYLARHTVRVFVIYRLALGSGVLILLAAGLIS
jgi:undecaprenyl-diphosphatase